MDLATVRAFLFDLDGCVYTGNTPIPGVIDVLERLRAQGRRLFFLTNNSRESGAEIQVKLDRMGVSATAAEILSGTEAAGPFLLDRFGPSSVLTTGSDTMGRLLQSSGHRLVPLDAYRDAGVVLMSHDPHFDFQKLTALSRAVARGAAFVAVNRDPRLPLEGDDFLPGCGTLTEAVATASGVQPILIGKPEPYLFRLALARLGVEAAHAAMVGDDLNADVWGASRLGLKTIWLAASGAPPSATLRPDLTIRSFSDLLRRR